MKKLAYSLMIVSMSVFVLSAFAGAQGFRSGGFMRQNGAGGISGGAARGFRTPQGGSGHAWGFSSDGQGNVAGGSARAFRGPNGRTGARSGGFTRSADGTINHRSGAAVSGQRGSIATRGSFSKDSSGNVSGSRNTTATSQSGAYYEGSTAFNSSSGVQHTGTCYDAAGNAVACPGR
jgi:hypothetical protein